MVKIYSGINQIWKLHERWGEGSSKLFLGGGGCFQKIPEVSRKYLVIILSCDLTWADQVNYTSPGPLKALYFIMRVLIKGNTGVLISP